MDVLSSGSMAAWSRLPVEPDDGSSACSYFVAKHVFRPSVSDVSVFMVTPLELYEALVKYSSSRSLISKTEFTSFYVSASCDMFSS
jgi:hypothetical protein